VTSDFISASVNTNPVVIRRIMGLLRRAGLIEVATGTGGIRLARDPKNITLLDIYRASESDGRIFTIHQGTAQACPVGRNIDGLLSGHFDRTQNAMEASLAESTLADLLAELDDINKRSGVSPPRGSAGRTGRQTGRSGGKDG